MDKKILFTQNAPKPIGHYSQAVMKNNTLYISGSLPLDVETLEIVGETTREQTNQALKNLFAVLRSANMTADNVVRTTIYLTNMEDYKDVNDMYQLYFTKEFPARTCVEVRALPMKVKVLIDAVAVAS